MTLGGLGSPGGDIEGLFLGEETEKVRKLERRNYRGVANWVERRLHVLGGGGSSGKLSSCPVPQQSPGEAWGHSLGPLSSLGSRG